jgi:hypothetical protein
MAPLIAPAGQARQGSIARASVPVIAGLAAMKDKIAMPPCDIDRR